MLSTINKEVAATNILEQKDKRILWLINHTTLREFEVPLLRSFGFEIYTPKCIPELVYGWSGSIEYAYDDSLSIPQHVITTLNQHNFYDDPITPHIAEIINEYFGTAFCVFWPKMLHELVSRFNGRILLRAFGLDKKSSYWDGIVNETGLSLIEKLHIIKDRFWFAQCYDNLAEVESDFIKSRTLTLPLGLPKSYYRFQNTWTGGTNKILFFCARINTSFEYYGKIYEDFKKYFGHLSYTVAGNQPTPVKDKNVAGQQPREVIDEWLRTYAVMFYHSREPRHLHYHPLEAMIVGMPVIYMRGGMLERLGGEHQPGACETLSEARKKIEKVLGGDHIFIAEIKKHQIKILETFNLSFNEQAWQDKFVLDDLKQDPSLVSLKKKVKKIAVFLPIPYFGGSLNGAKNIAKMIHLGSRAHGEPIDVVFSCIEGSYDLVQEFSELTSLGIQVRETKWVPMHVKDVTFSCDLVSNKKVKPYDEYLLPLDGVNNFHDCDFWFVISDRFSLPLAPVKPYGLMIYDYIQRYVPQILQTDDVTFLATARNAEFVLTTTPTTQQDAIQYAGVNANRVYLAPMEFNPFDEEPDGKESKLKYDYILWPSNIAAHKNHLAAIEALELYYRKYQGKLRVFMTGYKTDSFDLKNKKRDKIFPHVEKVAEKIAGSKYCKKNLKIVGNISASNYLSLLANAKFLWHPALIDNGTYAVIEAAYHHVPSLSSNYPQMHYINERFRLNLGFFDQYDPKDMAEKLKLMEEQYEIRRQNLPSREFLDQFSYTKTAPEFWKLLRSLI